jgi:hypothetical protein
MADEFTDKAKEVKDLVSYHLRDRTLTDEDNQRLLNGLGAHDDHGHLMRFPETPFTEPTNNRAERMLRPAVIARKVSQCSKTQQGPKRLPHSRASRKRRSRMARRPSRQSSAFCSQPHTKHRANIRLHKPLINYGEPFASVSAAGTHSVIRQSRSIGYQLRQNTIRQTALPNDGYVWAGCHYGSSDEICGCAGSIIRELPIPTDPQLPSPASLSSADGVFLTSTNVATR